MSNLTRQNFSEPAITSTYAGEFAGKYIAAGVLSAPTLKEEGITIMPNVKFKSVLKKLANVITIADATCDYTDTADVTLTEKVLEVTEKQVNLTLCKTPFEEDWQAVSMGYSSFDTLPQTFTDFFIANMLEQVSYATETTVWNSLISQAIADGADDSLNPGTLTAANIIDTLGDALDLLPSNVYGKEDLTFYMGFDAYKAYVRALGGFAANGVGANGVDGKGTMWYNGIQSLTFDGVKIFVSGELTNKVVLARKSNLYFGIGLLDNLNEVRVLDMAPLDGSKNVRFVMRWSQGTQVGFGNEIVLVNCD
jgi:hypothetical protein